MAKNGKFLELRIRPAGLLGAGIFLFFLTTVAGFFGEAWWVLDLFAHFRVQYAVVLVAAAGMFVLLREKGMAVACCFFAAVNLVVIFPLYFGKAEWPEPGRPVRRAVVMNVNTKAGDPEKVRKFLIAEKADIVVLEEVGEKWMEELKGIVASYPYKILKPMENNFGIALLSRLPIREGYVEGFGSTWRPSIIAELEDGRQSMRVFATHPLPPTTEEHAADRNAQFAALAELANSGRTPVMILGDLNCSPWSGHFRRLVEKADLRDSAVGFGVQPTWPTWIPPMFIPLDHCLHSPEIVILDRRVGPDVGSDHLPLVVDFQLRRAEALKTAENREITQPGVLRDANRY